MVRGIFQGFISISTTFHTFEWLPQITHIDPLGITLTVLQCKKIALLNIISAFGQLKNFFPVIYISTGQRWENTAQKAKQSQIK